MKQTRRLEIRIDRETLAKLDDNRGSMSRSEWLRDKIAWFWHTGKGPVDERQDALRKQV